MDKRAITVDPATGRLMLDGQLLDRYDPRLWGSVGRPGAGHAALRAGSLKSGDQSQDDRYLERARRIAQEEFARTHTGSESGEVAGSNINWDDYSLQDLVNLYGGSRFEEATTLFDDDPLAQQFRDQYGGAGFDPGSLRFGFEDPTLYGHGADEWMVDPRRVMRTGDGRRIWEGGNVRGDVLARYQSEDDDSGLGDSDAWWRAGVGTVLGGGMLNNYLSAGSLMGGVAATPGLAGTAPAGISMIDGGLPAIFDAGGAGVTMTPAALGAAAVPGGASSGGGFLSTLGSALSGGGAGLGDVISSGATSLGNAITSNPGTAIRGIAGLGAAIAGSRGGGGGGGGSGGGGVGDFNDLLSAQANANRVDINTPTGSRRWSQGADGRWTVNDSMSPEEQANYENVRTMNAGATDYARQLLARTMARPQRDYFAALPPTSSYFSRWGQ